MSCTSRKKNGLGRAYIAGFKWALERNYEFIFEMDCDFSHDPDEIPNFLKAAQNADLVIGSRYSGGVRVVNWPLKRLLLSRCAGIYVWLITGMPITFAERVEGKSKLSRGIVTEALWMVWWLWLQNGLRRWPRKKA